MVLGKEHPSKLTSMNNLALVLSDQGKYEQAEEMHQQGLGLCEMVLGKDRPSTLTSANNLALVLSGRDASTSIQAEGDGAWVQEHLDTLKSMDDLASVLKDQGKYGQTKDPLTHSTSLTGAKRHPPHCIKQLLSPTCAKQPPLSAQCVRLFLGQALVATLPGRGANPARLYDLSSLPHEMRDTSHLDCHMAGLA